MGSITQTIHPVQAAARFATGELEAFLQPLLTLWPDKRLRESAKLLVQGLITARSPHLTKAMSAAGQQQARAWTLAKRGYRLLHSPRVPTRLLTKSLYRLAQRVVGEEGAQRLVVAIDPVQFEKPYARRLEGVSLIYKSRPPDAKGKARISWGYPAITATVVNLKRPATTYVRWFSYQSTDFVSQNRQVYRSIRTTRALFPQYDLCFVIDGIGDDRKFFRWVRQVKADFIVPVAHRERVVEVWNERLQRWETITVGELMELVLWQGAFEAYFHRAGRTKKRTLRLGWFRLRLPKDPDAMWLLIVETLDATDEEGRLLGLLTSLPIETISAAQRVYEEWRLRGRIEHGYRFDQEAGLDVEQLLVRSLEAMHRLFVFVLWAMHFVFHALSRWPRPIVLWFQRVGGKLGRTHDRSGPYCLLWGLAKVWYTITVYTSMAAHPFPSPGLPPPHTFG